MNKKSFVLIALLALLTFSAKAQWFDFTNNVRASIGLNFGSVGYQFDSHGVHPGFADFGMGACLSVGGVYLDFIYQSPEHRHAKVTPGQGNWNDHTALTINAGYQIPVLHWLFVTPVVGYSNETTGITKAYDVTAEQSRIVHKYERENIYHHFNYGVGLMLRPFRWVEIGAIATSHAIYGNISLSLGIISPLDSK